MKTLFLISVLLLSLSFVGCGSSSSSDAASTASTNKNFVMLYVAGSDLEENAQAASIDFDEIIVGYNRLSSSEKEDLGIVVAFGGARLNGWRGIRYADVDCLMDDSRDGVYGNDSCYDYKNSNANMGSADALRYFLDTYSSVTSSSERSYLIFWNHGGAYQGVCYDANKGDDRLEIHELDSAMRDTNVKVDVIGMDACLMANIEVLKGVKEYSDYYLASEESEPGHGWDYEDVVSIIGKGTNQPLSVVGAKLVDSYLDSPKHSYSEDLTLSFLDLSRVDDVVDKIESLTQALDAESDFKAIGLSANEAQKFGVSSGNKDGMIIDLKSFSQNIGLQKSSLKGLSDDLTLAVDSLVVYSRGKGIEAHGVTIYQPLYSRDWSNYNSLSYTASAGWQNLLSNFTVTKGADNQNPIINSEESCVNGSQEGFCLNISDNVALKSVESYGLLPFGDNYMLLYTEILSSSGDKYFLPKFNDKWLYLCDGDSQSQCVFPSAFEIESQDVNTKLYVSMGQYNGKDVSFIIKTQGGEVNMWAILDTDGSYASKQQYQVKQGDSVRFDYIVVTSNADITIINGDSLTFSDTPRWVKEDFNANIEYYASADDFNDNAVYSDSHFTETTGSGSSGTSVSVDTTSDQSRLSYLEGKTATFNYDYYGVAYSETIAFNEAPIYNTALEQYIIKGLRNNAEDIYCFSGEEESSHATVYGVVYMYDCPGFFADDSKDLFAFNVNSDQSLSGYYEYVHSGDSSLSLYDEIKTPDAELVSSSIR